MTAFEEIKAALGAAPPKRKAWDRVIFVGDSAARSLAIHFARPGTTETNLSLILPEHWPGTRIMIRRTDDFAGWAIREIGPAGRWHDVEAAA